MREIRNFENQTIAARQNKKERDYWLTKLAGKIEKSSFPYTNEKTFVNETKQEEIRFAFSEEVSSRLIKIGREYDPNVFAILTAGLVLLLHKYSGNKDITIGIPVLKQEIEGNFINTVLTLRKPVEANKTFKEFLLQVRQTIAEAVENQNYPIETLVYNLGLEFNETDFPLFDTAVLLKNIQDKSYLHPIKPNITFSFLRTGQLIEGELEYNALLYDKAALQGVIGHLENLLQVIIFDPAVKIASIEILSIKEKQHLLIDFNNNHANFPTDKMISSFLEKHGDVNPDKMAITFKNEQLTYKELNSRTNQLARVLKNRGIHRGKFVGILLNRSLLMAVNILSVWKAGGTYVPIDPSSPIKRIRYILDDCQISILLTDSQNLKKFSFTTLQGFQYKNINIHKTDMRQPITKFDDLPFPDRSRVDYEKYSQHIGQALIKNSITLQATRGCPYDCAYCHKIWPKKHITRSAENIFEEVLLYFKMGVKRFVIIDDIFNLNIRNSSRFFELIIENNLKVQLFFPNGLRGDILTKKYIDLMVQAGTVGVALALETASPRLQKLIRKELNLEKLRENINYFCEKYPQVILELFTMHGFPTETEEEAMMTMKFLKDLKWIHFPYIEILKIFPNTDIEKLAIENGISKELIIESEDLAFHDFSKTLPFDKNFTLKYKSDYLNEYFLLKERLLHVLSYQVKVLTEDELVQKYNSYLDAEINNFSDLLKFAEISENEFNQKDLLDENYASIPGLNKKLQDYFPKKLPGKDALNVLLLDLSMHFTTDISSTLYNVVEIPLGLLYLMSYLDQSFGNRINGKIAKSRIDFDSYDELKTLLEKFKPRVIGIRSLSHFKNFFHKTITAIRNWGFDVPIIAGGPYATSAYDRILQDKNVDLVVLGEGEVTFAELVKSIMENNKNLPNDEVLNEIAGIAFVPKKVDAEKKYARDILLSDQLEGMLSREPVENLEPVNYVTDIVYTIYTSGSIGNPKGAMIEHKGMMNHIHTKINDLQLTGESIIAQNASHCFDISVWQFFTALVVGGKTMIYPDECILNPEQFLSKLLEDQVTILEVVPSYLSLLLDILDLDLKKSNCLKYLTYLLVTGETVKPGLVKRWFEKYPEIKMVNAYGPTEASDDITHYIMDKAPETREIPIGKPLQNMNIYIVDEHMKLCPLGVKGEVVVSGVCVGRGYLNDPEKTNQAFTNNPFVDRKSKETRLYKTNDIGCWLPDGTIAFFGRKDYQVKIRGYRIELEEIEKKLVNYPVIKEAVVIEKERFPEKSTGEPEKVLCAFMVSREKVNHAGVKEYLEEVLPGYMIPEYIEQIDELPITPNGKVDRNALAKLEISLNDAAQAGAENKIQEKLLAIWSDVLAIDRQEFGIDANFFHLGGHSIRATLLAAKIHKEFNTRVQLKDIFEYPTIRKFSKLLKKTGEDQFIAIKSVEKKEYYPLSSAQKRLFLVQQLDPEKTAYNLHRAFILLGTPQKEKLEHIFKQLITRHESLRTSFAIIDEEPVQRIHAPDEVDFRMEYYQVTEEIEKHLRNFIHFFDLSRAPLMRVGLMKEKEDRHFLVVDMHHIITDGTSLEIIYNDFRIMYSQQEIRPLTIQYKDYSIWQNELQESGGMKQQEEYWLRQFEGEIPSLNLMPDSTWEAVENFEGEFVKFPIEEGLSQRLKEFTNETGTTLYIILMAVYMILLSKYTGQEDMIVGSGIAGRNHADLNNIIGMFVNMLAMRNRPEKTKTFREFLEEVKKQTLDAFANQDFQFDELVKKLGLPRDWNRNPLFDTQFTFQNMEAEPVDVQPTDLAVVYYEFQNKIMPFDLSLNGIELREKIEMSLGYVKAFFKHSLVEKMGSHYIEILEQVLENRDILLMDIKLSHEMMTGKTSFSRDEYTDGFDF